MRTLMVATGLATTIGAGVGVALGLQGVWVASAALVLAGLIVWMVVGSHVEKTLHRLQIKVLSWENHVGAHIAETGDLPMPIVRDLFRRPARYRDPAYPEALATWTATGDPESGFGVVTIAVDRLGVVSTHLLDRQEA